MPQLNIHLTHELQESLAELMRLRDLKTESEAVRQAVLEALERELTRRQAADFRTWLGLGNAAPQNACPQFISDDDLWAE